MSPKQTTAFRLDTNLLAAMREVKDRDGVPLTTQMEMALREWLSARGALAKTERGTRGKRGRRSSPSTRQ